MFGQMLFKVSRKFKNGHQNVIKISCRLGKKELQQKSSSNDLMMPVGDSIFDLPSFSRFGGF